MPQDCAARTGNEKTEKRGRIVDFLKPRLKNSRSCLIRRDADKSCGICFSGRNRKKVRKKEERKSGAGRYTIRFQDSSDPNRRYPLRTAHFLWPGLPLRKRYGPQPGIPS